MSLGRGGHEENLALPLSREDMRGRGRILWRSQHLGGKHHEGGSMA